MFSSFSASPVETGAAVGCGTGAIDGLRVLVALFGRDAVGALVTGAEVDGDAGSSAQDSGQNGAV